MECVKCGGRTRVLNSRNSGDAKNALLIPSKYRQIPGNFTFRDHKCIECGNNFQSIQVPAYAMSEKLDKIDSDINQRVKSKLMAIADAL